MSINVAMIPFVLAARVVMGKEKFDEWVASQEERYVLKNIKKDKVQELLLLNNYDCIEYGKKLLKVHYKNSKNYFLLEKNGATWDLVLSVYDTDKEKQEALKIFRQFILKEIITEEKEVFPTNFADELMLRDTLLDYGIKFKQNGTNFIIEEDNYSIVLQQENSGFYNAEIHQDNDFKLAYARLNALDSEYKNKVQEYVYMDVKSNIENSKEDIEIIDEYVDEEDSIVLRVRV